MVKVANLSADLTANTSSFDANLKRSSNRLNRTGRSMSRDAANFNKKVSNSFRNVSRNVALIEGPLGGIAGRLSALSAISGTSGVAILGVAVAVGSLGLALTKAARIGDQFEGSMNRVNAVIKATGGAAGITAQEIRDFSQELARGTLASVAGVEAAAAKLLTFRSIAGDTFRRTLVLAQDLAATGFGSLSDNVTQLGKALEDPIRNLGALTRNGVSFSQQQKDVIKTLVETGQAAKAQGIILDALAQQVGGTGGAEGGPIARGYDSLTQSVDNFFVALDDRTGAGTRFAKFLNDADFTIRQLTKTLDPPEDTLIEQLSKATEELNLLVSQSAEEFRQLKREGKSDIAAGEYVNTAIQQQRKLIDGIEARIDAENKKAIAVKATSAAVQAQIVAEAEAGRVEEAQKKAAEKREKAEKRRQEQIKTTIENLRQAVTALEEENNLLALNTVSIEEAATVREILLMQQRLGVEAISAEGQALDNLIKKRNALQSSIKQEAVLRTRVKQIIAENKTETEALNDELREFQQLRKDGELTEEQYQRAVERTKEKIEELDESQQRLKDTIEDIGDAAKATFKEFLSGAKSAGEAVRELGVRMLETFANKAIDTIFDEVGGAIIKGVFGGAKADGGPVSSNKTFLVGEEGPELFTPNTNGTIISHDELTSGGTGGPTIFADMRGASVEAVARLERFVAELNGSIEPRAIDAVTSEKARNPELFR